MQVKYYYGVTEGRARTWLHWSVVLQEILNSNAIAVGLSGPVDCVQRTHIRTPRRLCLDRTILIKWKSILKRDGLVWLSRQTIRNVTGIYHCQWTRSSSGNNNGQQPLHFVLAESYYIPNWSNLSLVGPIRTQFADSFVDR